MGLSFPFPETVANVHLNVLLSILVRPLFVRASIIRRRTLDTVLCVKTDTNYRHFGRIPEDGVTSK